MAIQVRQGLKTDFNPDKMLPGEWAVSIDSETERQMVWMCFAAGVTKRMGTYEDFRAQIEEATKDIRDGYIKEFDIILQQVRELADKTQENTEQVIQVRDDILEKYLPQILAAMESAVSSASAAAGSATAANASEKEAAHQAEAAKTSADVAEASKKAAGEHEEAAKKSAKDAGGSADAAGKSEQAAEEYKEAAKNSADIAEQSERAAGEHKVTAERAAHDAGESAANAAESEKAARDWADLSMSYAVGTDDRVRPDDSANNAKEYARRAEEAAKQAEVIAGGDFIKISEKGAAGGVATLGEDGKVPSEQIPKSDVATPTSDGLLSANDKTKLDNIGMKFYTSLEGIGCTKTSTLQEIVEALPLNSYLGVWITNGYAAWDEITTSIGTTSIFGYLKIERNNSNLWELTYSLYDLNGHYTRKYTTINNKGWTDEWEWSSGVSDDYLPLTGGTLSGGLNVGAKLKFRTDNEGGNIDIISPDAYGVTWELDAYNGNLRAYANKSGTITTPLVLCPTVSSSLFYGNSASASKLQTARKINGVSFDGTADVTLPNVTTSSPGLVPKLNGSTSSFLRGDGAWATPPNTTYGLASTSANGLLKALNNNASYFMNGQGNWAIPSVTGAYLPLAGGTMTGDIYFNNTTAVWRGDSEIIFIGSTVNGNRRVQVGALAGVSSLCPDADNLMRLGNGLRRWSEVNAGSGTIVTSDRNLKKDIEPIRKEYKEFFRRLRPSTFKFIDGTSGRTHAGFISQDVEEALKDVGLADMDFAGFCKDSYPEYDKEVYSLRYDEFVALNTSMIQDLYDEVEMLKQKLEAMSK